MSIPNKQIGWSQEANLMWEIANALDKSLKVIDNSSFPYITTTTTTTAPPPENRFEYSPGNVPTIGAFEAIIGFTLTDASIEGNTIKFSDVGYAIPDFAFLDNPNLISVVTFADSAGVQSFRNCANLGDVSAPVMTSAGANCFVFNYLTTSLYFPQLVTAGAACFSANELITDFDFPLLQTVGSTCFDDCFAASRFNLPSVTNLGGSVLDNNVFRNIVGNTVTITIPSALMTNNAGGPDGDIVELQANNTVTVITV